MAKKRKKTRKELLKEPDEFITFSGKLIQFAAEHRTHITYALGIILSLAVIISGIRFVSIRSENNASILLDKGLSQYNSLRNTEKPDDVYLAVS